LPHIFPPPEREREEREERGESEREREGREERARGREESEREREREKREREREREGERREKREGERREREMRCAAKSLTTLHTHQSVKMKKVKELWKSDLKTCELRGAIVNQHPPAHHHPSTRCLSSG